MGAAMQKQMEVVELGGQILDFDTVLADMDPRIFEEALEWCGYNATPQAIVDEYVRLVQASTSR